MNCRPGPGCTVALVPRQSEPLPTAEAARLWPELGTVTAVAAALGTGRDRASAALRAAGINARQPPHRAPRKLDPHKEAIRRAYLDDHTPIPELAARYGVSVSVLNKYLYRNGISRYRRLTLREHDQITSLTGQGTSVPEIARLLDVSGKTIKRHLRDQPRPRLRDSVARRSPAN